jgi:O-antigen/teichoic acid export membrane protein
MKSKAIKSIFWLTLDKSLRLFVGLYISVWLAKYLGPEKFGTLSYCIAFCSVFMAIIQLGLRNIFVRDILQNPDKEKEILGSSSFLILAAGIVCFTLICSVNAVIHAHEGLIRYLIYIIGAGSLFQSYHVISYYFDSKVESKYAVIASNLVYVIMSITKLYLLFAKADLECFALVILFEQILTFLFMHISLASRGEKIIKWKLSMQKSKSLIKDSYPFALSSILVILYMRVDQIMLKYLTDEEGLGYYSIVVRLTEITFFIPTILQTVLMPRLIKYCDDRGERHYYKMLSSVFSMVAVPMAVGALLISLLSSYLVPYIYGQEYEYSGFLLSIHIWLVIPVGISMIKSIDIVRLNATKVHLSTTLVGLCINLVLNFALIPVIGVVGASVASLLSYMYVAIGSNFIFDILKPVGGSMFKGMLTPVSNIKYLIKNRNEIFY